jgi:hypothetical protein
MKNVEVARRLKDRREQRAVLQYWKPENWRTVRTLLIRVGRTDLIGHGSDCLIRPTEPGRRKQDRSDLSGSRSGYRHAARKGTGRTRS